LLFFLLWRRKSPFMSHGCDTKQNHWNSTLVDWVSIWVLVLCVATMSSSHAIWPSHVSYKKVDLWMLMFCIRTRVNVTVWICTVEFVCFVPVRNCHSVSCPITEWEVSGFKVYAASLAAESLSHRKHRFACLWTPHVVSTKSSSAMRSNIWTDDPVQQECLPSCCIGHIVCGLGTLTASS